MTPQDQIKALAELAGWPELLFGPVNNVVRRPKTDWMICPRYLTSYDAIIPLIQKQSPETVNAVVEYFPSLINATPAQLCEALLRATGKWKDNEH